MAPVQEDATYLDRAYCDGVRVLLAEYDATLRQILRPLLRHGNDVSIVVDGEDGTAAVGRALHTHPHAAVFDNQMPRLSGIDAALHLGKLQPALRSNSAVRA
jgi:DNA-binding NarL/FixJ family response regulator